MVGRPWRQPGLPRRLGIQNRRLTFRPVQPRISVPARKCESGGIGRRAGLRSLWSLDHGGSIPPFRTNLSFVRHRLTPVAHSHIAEKPVAASQDIYSLQMSASSSNLPAEAKHLGATDPLDLIGELGDTIEDADLLITTEEREILESRMADLETNPSAQEPWLQTKSWLESRRG
jgi:hypothetical protein